MRSSACDTLTRSCARHVLCWPASPWPPSLAPPAPRRITPLCSSASLLLRRSQTSRVRASSASTPRLPDADLGAFALRPNPRPPGSRAKSFHTCQGLRPRRAGRALAITRPSMSPSVILTTSAPETILLSRLNGWPMHSPVNASSASSRIPTHNSAPMRLATPSSQRTFTAYSLPVTLCRFLPAHQKSRNLHRAISALFWGLLRDAPFEVIPVRHPWVAV